MPISLVCQWVYCPRRAWLEAAGEMVDSYQMEAGISAHENVDNPVTARFGEARSLEVSSESLGVTGKLDCVFFRDGGAEIVEYKATPIKKRPVVTEAMRIQLALQERCLIDSGYAVSSVSIFFTSHHRRFEVKLSDEDRELAKAAVANTMATIAAELAPKPLEGDGRCCRCSHADVCLPEERHLRAVPHRIAVPIGNGRVVHLATPGSYAFCEGGRLRVECKNEELANIPLETVQSIHVHGNVNLSSGLIRELLWRDVKVLWCTNSGRLVGWSTSSYGPNGKTRVQQHVASAEGRLSFAREFIASKISNQATQLRRGGVDRAVVDSLRAIQHEVAKAIVWQDILGYEGKASAIYFSVWPKLIKKPKCGQWLWGGRSGRPARDPLNAMLNYAYSLLLADTVKALISCGLDPHAGFLHSSNRNKPALALDLMEEFRAPIADSVVQTIVNNGTVEPCDFAKEANSIRLKDPARKALIAAYERRMDTQIKHPIFGYPASWRRISKYRRGRFLVLLMGHRLGTRV